MKTLYLSDLDGTLLTPEAALSPFTAETLRRLLGSGMAFSYATARSFSTAKKVTAALKGARLPVIVYNGAAIVEAESGAVLDAVYFTPAETAFIRGVLEAAGLRPMVYSRAKAHVRAERVAYVEAGGSRGLAQYLETRGCMPSSQRRSTAGAPFISRSSRTAARPVRRRMRRCAPTGGSSSICSATCTATPTISRSCRKARARRRPQSG